MNNPLVSIIIPIHNRLDLLRPTLKSVINQTYKDWIGYLCDDGSSENVKSVLDEYADARFIHKRLSHEGVGSTRNRGIAMAETPYLIMLDSDDVWHERFLELAVAFLESMPNIDAVQTAQAVIDWEGTYVIRRTEMLTMHKKETFRNLAYTISDGLIYFLTEPYGPNNLSSLVIKTSVAKKVKAEEITFMEDWDYLIKLGKQGFIVAYLDEVLCYYRNYARSIVPDKQIRTFKATIIMLKKHHFHERWQHRIRKQIIGNVYEMIGFDYLLLNKRWAASAYFISSLWKRFTVRRIYGLCLCVVPGIERFKIWLLKEHEVKDNEVLDHGERSQR